MLLFTVVFFGGEEVPIPSTIVSPPIKRRHVPCSFLWENSGFAARKDKTR